MKNAPRAEEIAADRGLHAVTGLVARDGKDDLRAGISAARADPREARRAVVAAGILANGVARNAEHLMKGTNPRRHCLRSISV